MLASKTKKEVILTTQDDWREWLSQLKSVALGAKVWTHINPSKSKDEMEDIAPEEPKITPRPKPAGYTVEGVFNQAEYDLAVADWKLQVEEVRFNHIKWEKVEKGFDRVREHIYQTISKGNQDSIKESDSVINIVKSLKARFGGSSLREQEMLQERYYSLRKPKQGTTKEKWHRQWLELVNDYQAAGLDAKINEKTTVRDFIRSTQMITPDFCRKWWDETTRGENLNIKYMEKTGTRVYEFPTIEEILTEFQMYETFESTISNSSSRQYAFGTLNGRSDGRKPREQKQDSSERKAPPCECDPNRKRRHWYYQCFYFNQYIRPEGWNENPGIRKKLDKMEKDDPFKAAQFEKARQRAEEEYGNKNKKNEENKETISQMRKPEQTSKRKESKHAHYSREEDESDLDSAFSEFSNMAMIQNQLNEEYQAEGRPTIPENVNPIAMSATTKHMKKAVILDSGTTSSIFNSKKRFLTFTKERQKVSVGDTISILEGYGSAVFYPTMPGGRKSRKGVILKKVWYMPGAHTNLVSQSQLEDMNIWYDGRERRLVEGEKKALCEIKKDKLYFIEWDKKHYEPVGKKIKLAMAVASNELKTLRDPRNVWHQRFGHASDEAMLKLQNSTLGSIVDPPTKGKRNEEGFRNICEVCARTEAYKKISRVPTEAVMRPFEKVSMDLIIMEQARDGNTVALHLVDHYSGFHILETFKTRSVQYELVAMINWIMRQFNTRIRHIHGDGEGAFMSDYVKDYCRNQGILLTNRVPETPEQNGRAEVAGKMLSKRARAMTIDANLPRGMWPQAMKASCYILNRTPMERHDWKTPFEMIFRKPPYIGNIYLWGSKAYLRLTNVPKSHKMAPRAQVGYLVGYKSHNVWEIWNPESGKVVLGRDVLFDETQKYDSNRPNDALVVTEQETRVIENLVIPNIMEADEDEVFDSLGSGFNLSSTRRNESTTQNDKTGSMEPMDTAADETSEAVRQDEPDTGIREANMESTATLEGQDSRKSVSEAIQNDNDVNMTENSPGAPPERGQQQDYASEKQKEDDSGRSKRKMPKNEAFGEVEEDGIRQTKEGQQQGEGASRSEPGITINPAVRPDMANQIQKPHPDQLLTPPPTNPLFKKADSSEPQGGTSPDESAATKVLAAKAAEISADFNENNIINGSRNRIPSKRALGSPIHLKEPLPKKARKQRRANYARLKLEGEEPLIHSMLAATGLAPGYFQKGTKAPYRKDLIKEPENERELHNHPMKDEFYKGMKDEFKKLKTKGTFQYVDIEKIKGKQILPVRWVLKYKFDENNRLTKVKARLVVRGDLQRLTLTDTRAATLAARVFRMMMALAAAFDLEIMQYDAVNAFVNSLLDEEVYIHFPPGLAREGKAIKLIRALYGLKRSPRLWQQDLNNTLSKFGFKRVADEECLWVGKGIILMYYVDDFIVMYDRKDQNLFDEFDRYLNKAYEVRRMPECSWFLGMRILRNREEKKLYLCQDSYIQKMAQKFNLDKKVVLIPKTDFGGKYEGEATPREIKEYQERVGSALYATIMTRADMAKLINKLSEFSLNPAPEHREAIEEAIAYLNTTRNLVIMYSGPNPTDEEVFQCASDAAFADNKDRTSSEAYVCKLYGGIVDWRASKQRAVTTSTTEAELRAATEAGKRMYVWKRLFRAIGFKPDHELKIKCDNKQTVRLLTCEDPHFQTNLKHVDIYHHWLREKVQLGELTIEWVRTTEMPADGLTKMLRGQQFKSFVKHLGLVDIGHLLQE